MAAGHWLHPPETGAEATTYAVCQKVLENTVCPLTSVRVVCDHDFPVRVFDTVWVC